MESFSPWKWQQRWTYLVRITANEMDATGKRMEIQRKGAIVGPCHMMIMPSAELVRNRAEPTNNTHIRRAAFSSNHRGQPRQSDPAGALDIEVVTDNARQT